MLNINKKAFFSGLLVVASLLLLDSCGCRKDDKKETPKQKLEKEEQRLIGEIAQKLSLTADQKKQLEEKFQKDKQTDKVEKEKKHLDMLKKAKESIQQENNVSKIQVWVNIFIASFDIPGVHFTGDKKEAQELVDLAIALKENYIAQLELRDKAKK